LPTVAVIGGGYAGMAAAVTLAEAGVPVTVFEAARELGGRARRVVVNGVTLDNGLHILVGAYRETLRLVHAVHPSPSQALERLPFDWHVHRRFRLKAAPLPAPLHLAAALIGARGAPWRERIAAARFMRAMQRLGFRLEHDVTVTALLATHGQGPAFTRYFWEPLCIAALNTPPARASAQVFLNVLRDGLNSSREAGDLLLAHVDLTALFPEPAGAYVCARGGEVVTGATVDGMETRANSVIVRTRAGETAYDHAICAVSPHRAAAIVSEIPELGGTIAVLGGFRYQPIYSVYLQFSQSVRLPAGMLGLEGVAQWVFDREALCGQRGLVGAVISAEGAHEDLSQDMLARAVHDQLERELGALPPLSWHRVIAEKRATFECSVGLDRPTTRTPLSNVHLAGDYTASDYPATIEAAIRSGIAAARQVIEAPAKL
jgi:squalene-associated FAD-dependent desaturase